MKHAAFVLLSALLSAEANQAANATNHGPRRLASEQPAGSWTELTKLINAAISGQPASFKLAPDFKFDYDSKNNGEIAIGNKEITIHGNDVVMDARGDGRFFYVSSAAVLTLYSLTMKNGNYNHFQGGGAIGMDKATLNIYKCVFEKNSAKDKGGAIFMEGSKFTMKESRLISNSAKSGGAIFLHSTEASIYDSTLSKNNADKLGGAIIAYSNTVLNLNSVHLDSNVAVWFGGALRVMKSKVIVHDSDFRDNIAEYRHRKGRYAKTKRPPQSHQAGAGAISSHAARVSMFNTTLERNVAEGKTFEERIYLKAHLDSDKPIWHHSR